MIHAVLTDGTIVQLPDERDGMPDWLASDTAWKEANKKHLETAERHTAEYQQQIADLRAAGVTHLGKEAYQALMTPKNKAELGYIAFAREEQARLNELLFAMRQYRIAYLIREPQYMFTTFSATETESTLTIQRLSPTHAYVQIIQGNDDHTKAAWALVETQCLLNKEAIEVAHVVDVATGEPPVLSFTLTHDQQQDLAKYLQPELHPQPEPALP
jgi:hypothetical protein